MLHSLTNLTVIFFFVKGKGEGIKMNRQALTVLYEMHHGDIRACVTALQVLCTLQAICCIHHLLMFLKANLMADDSRRTGAGRCGNRRGEYASGGLNDLSGK